MIVTTNMYTDSRRDKIWYYRYMARPKKEVDEQLIYDLARIHCTNKEIAAMCRISQETLEKRFLGIIKDGREQGKASLRRMQWKAAQEGKVPMLIWLGKQLLGQLENPGLEDDEVPETIAFSFKRIDTQRKEQIAVESNA